MVCLNSLSVAKVVELVILGLPDNWLKAYDVSENACALISLHWLRVPERIRSKVAVLDQSLQEQRSPQRLGKSTR